MPNNTKIDVQLYYGCMPPIIIPVSARAKERLVLSDGVVGAIFMDDPGDVVLAAIMDSHWVVGEVEELPEGELVQLMSIKVLH